jgi:hypothetical protein
MAWGFFLSFFVQSTHVKAAAAPCGGLKECILTQSFALHD